MFVANQSPTTRQFHDRFHQQLHLTNIWQIFIGNNILMIRSYKEVLFTSQRGDFCNIKKSLSGYDIKNIVSWVGIYFIGLSWVYALCIAVRVGAQSTKMSSGFFGAQSYSFWNS